MPRISQFFGIAIYMYFRDHVPPHFHAIYGEFDAEFLIESGEVLKGKFPKRGAGLVKEWAKMYKKDLERDWELVRAKKTPTGIPPLE